MLDPQIDELEATYSARIGIWAISPATGANYHHREDERFAMCSTFKTYAVAEVLRRSAEGTVSLDAAVTIQPDAIVENSPVMSKSVGMAVTLRQLCDAALTQSDNTAGNYLLRELGGPQAVTAIARVLGDEGTRLDRWEPELNNALRGDPQDTSTARSLAHGYQQLILGDALRPAERGLLVEWMRNSVTSGKRIRAGIPAGWTAADKTGAGRFATVNDVGVVWDSAGAPLVLAILTDTRTDREGTEPDNKLIADITTAIVRSLAIAG